MRISSCAVAGLIVGAPLVAHAAGDENQGGATVMALAPADIKC
jgi:hypothetical protein